MFNLITLLDQFNAYDNIFDYFVVDTPVIEESAEQFEMDM